MLTALVGFFLDKPRPWLIVADTPQGCRPVQLLLTNKGKRTK